MNNSRALHIKTFRKFIAQTVTFADADWEALSAHFEVVEAGRKECITAPGSIERYFYFVVEGLQRVYYIDDQGREATLVFTYAPSFGGVIDAMLLGQAAKFGYETLTKSVFLRAPFSEIAKLQARIPPLDLLMKQGVAEALSGILWRLAEVQCYSAEDRFRALLARSPHILGLIPHKYIASYLSMDPTNFSKLLNRVVV